ncbi:Vignain (Bean endopeptidase) (Cysteine proteinase EP-C1) [Durusdinium trenchii]|uniref:Vignain (Bean endopeptidase) (Cysteine proteinase EP-C1) n=1 Tax=Durusdinium trenchii TaxID=1381693 RepID=A0ABP0MCW6_9DINO
MELGQCRICLEEGGDLIQPCACEGSMRWVHAECLAEWWKHRSAGGVDLPTSGSNLRCDICGEDFALKRQACHLNLLGFLRRRLVECWQHAPNPFSEMREILRENHENRLRFRSHFKEHLSGTFLFVLSMWWAVSAMRVPATKTSNAASAIHTDALSPGMLRFMEVGCWAFPCALWFFVLVLAVTSERQTCQWTPRCIILDQQQWERLFVTLGIFLLLAASFGTFANGLGPGLQTHPALASWNLPAVLSPVVPLMIMKAERRWLWYLWPPQEDLLQVQAHLPYMLGISVITMSNLLTVGFMSLTQHVVVAMLEALPNVAQAQQAEENNLKQQYAIFKLLIATHVLGSMLASVHFPMLLRSMRAAGEEQLFVQVNMWSRLGALAIFIAIGDGIWLAIYGSPWCICIVQLWCVSFVCLCRLLGASPFTDAAAILLSPLRRLRTRFHLQLVRDSLQTGHLSFTNRTVPDNLHSRNRQVQSYRTFVASPCSKKLESTGRGGRQEIVDQGACGSCWAVSATTVLNAHSEIHRKRVRRFSTQEMINCVPNPQECGGQGGCQGATVELGIAWAVQNGLSEEQQLPYTAADGHCQKTSFLENKGLRGSVMGGASFGLAGFHVLPSNKEEPLARALAELGPVAVSVAANNWFNYYNGVFDDCDNIVNHAVTLYGYGKQGADKYWLVKNSWGPDWGENGFIRILRHSSEDTFCGMDTDPSKGVACKGGPKEVEVCGTCGILYDSVVPRFEDSKDA